MKQNREFLFTDKDFKKISKLIHEHAGILIAENKADMVYSRISRQVRSMGLNSFADYIRHLETSNREADWQSFTNCLTTNLTSFFREAHHFEILAEHMRVHRHGNLRIWCSACSTGEEPYSMAMIACEVFGTMQPPVEILATDIDTNVLEIAKAGVYSVNGTEKLSEERRRRFLLRGKGDNDGLLRIKDELKRMITFKKNNLLSHHWNIDKPFDAIFCRNTLIYFDKPTQAQVLKQFLPILKPHGLLFAGHSENFMFASEHYKLRGKTVYELKR